MYFLEFKEKLKGYSVLSTTEIEKYYPGFNKMNLVNWQKKGYIIKIRNGWYLFNEPFDNETRHFYIANKIYSPSYVSCESALHYYGFIPEAVFSIISVTTLKTNTFSGYSGFYKYNNIKPFCFFGYNLVSINNYTFKIADIEKTILDLLYLRSSIQTPDDIEALRLNKYILRKKLSFFKLSKYAALYNSKQLLRKIELLKTSLDD